MKPKVSQKHVNELSKRLAVEKVTLRAKPNYKNWTHWLVGWFCWLLLKCVGKDFHAYWTQLGDVIYGPSSYGQGGPDDFTLFDPDVYEVVCHELAHAYDNEAFGWSYKLTYIFSWADRGNLWEVRGYGMQMIAKHRTGRLSSADVASYTDAITGSAYLWAGNKKVVRRRLKELKRALDEHDGSTWNIYDPSLVPELPQP